jgi:7-cyano-7-deazaguanine synthase in queuosine biosynthesis
MQTLEQSGAKGALADVAARLFTWGSQWPLPELADVPPLWQGFVGKVGSFCGVDAKATGVGYPAPLSRRLDQRRVVVLFSGGKDGLATALKLRSDGLVPVLLHVRGINGAAYTHEATAARRVADVAGFAFRELRVVLRGKSDHIENPTKNLVLACLGASLAVQWGAGTVALGLLSEDTESTNPRCGLSVNIAVSVFGFAAIEAMTPGLRVIPATMPNDSASIRRVWHDCPAALPEISSCMAGARFKAKLHQANNTKFRAGLLPGRCGSCYKCALESITLAALEGRVLPSEWAAHCVEKLRRGAQIVSGSAALPSEATAFAMFMSDAVPWREALGLTAADSAT